MNLKNNKAITLISLVITIIVILIISSITVYTGTNIIKKAELENLRTNMLLIEAKSKEYVEEASFKMGPKSEELTDEEKNKILSETLKGDKLEEKKYSFQKNGEEIFYELHTEDLEKMGLTNIKSDNAEYVVEYNLESVSVEIYYSQGYEGKYSLTELKEL